MPTRRPDVVEFIVMLTFPQAPAGTLSALFDGLIRSHPASLLGAPQSRSARRDLDDRLARMPAHLRDDIGLPPAPPPEPEHPALARARRKASRWG